MIEFREYAELPSTQDTAFEVMESEPELKRLAVHTHHQKTGRGTRGRSWYSEKSKSLALSLAWRPSRQDLSGLSLAMGLSLADHLAKPVQIKWPNDLILEDRKVGGLLLETRTKAEDFVASLGIGLNLQDLANAEYAGLGLVVDPRAMADDVFLSIQKFEESGFAIFQKAFESVMWRRGESIQIYKSRGSKDLERVELMGVDERGQLCVRSNQGLELLDNAELTYD